MGDNFEQGLLVVILGTILIAVGSCTHKKFEVQRLNRQVKDLKEQVEDRKKEVWIDSCMRAVTMSCYIGECGTVSIEEMQEKICREDQI